MNCATGSVQCGAPEGVVQIIKLTDGGIAGAALPTQAIALCGRCMAIAAKALDAAADEAGAIQVKA